jgi:hypothetical protein
LAGLDYFWEKAKAYVDGVDSAMSGRVDALADVVGDSTKGLVKDLATLQETVNSLGNIEGGEGIGGMIDAKIAALDLPNTYDSKGSAAAAEAAAKSYVDGIVNDTTTEGGTVKGLNSRIAVLEAIDHEKLASDASAAAVATVLDGAPEKFDTLKEVAQWIADSESAADAADLVTRVAALEAIDHDAYKAADTALETSLKGYVNGKVDGKFDAAGAAATAKAEAIADAETKYQVKGNYETAGAAAQALTDAKKYADDTFQVKGNYETAGTAEAKIAELKLADTYEAKGAAADAQAAAIAQAKLDAAEALKGYYTKTEVDNLLSTNSTGDRAYAKQYTDELFGSFKFAANSDIDALFAPKAE